MSLFRDIDEKYVPRLAEALDRVARRFPKAPEPTGPLPVIVRLRRVDDRWTAAGPLALLREVPQLAAVAIGALIFAGGVTVKAREKPHAESSGPEASGSPSPGTGGPAGDGTLGPDIGENVPAYLAGAKARLRLLAPTRPDGTAVAVVSFATYQTPAQVRDLVGTLQVRQVFFRAPLPLPEGVVHSVPVEDVVRDSTQAFRRVAAVRAAEGKELLKVARTIENDPAQKSEHEKDGRLALREVAILRGPCRCIYAVVVRARLRLLADLLTLPVVRVVDVSEVDAVLEDLTFTALLPEERVTVTGGNQE